MSNQSRGKGNYAPKSLKTLLRCLKAFTASVSQDRILDFGTDPAFGRYKQFFPVDAIAHPAKANTGMIEWIIKRYTKEGDVIVDPMAGTFSTCVIAALNNRHGIGVELEDKFYQWGLEAKRRVERTQTLAPKGRMVVLKGDARELTKVLKENIDTVIFSPPYATSEVAADKEFLKKVIEQGRVRKTRWGHSMESEYAPSEDNVGGLPYGTPPDGGEPKADAVIFSPPFCEANRGGGIAVRGYDGPARKGHDNIHLRLDRPLSDAPDNISNGPYGAVDAVITSPPYEAQVSTKGDPERRTERMKVAGFDPKNMAQCAKIDFRYSENKSNIGNLKNETYLSEMFKVYRGCFEALKPNGRMVLVLKNFVRDRKVVRLDLDTIKLCEAVGFEFVERWYRKLGNPSFWRIIYAKKFNYCPRCVRVYRVRKATSDRPSLLKCPTCGAKLLPALVPFEDILVFRKVEK